MGNNLRYASTQLAQLTLFWRWQKSRSRPIWAAPSRRCHTPRCC